MHTTLASHIELQIRIASEFVIRYMPIGLEPEVIYEELIGNEEMAQAFANAAKYLPPVAMSKRMSIIIDDWGMQSVNVKLPPCDKYPTYLWPQQSTNWPMLTRQSRLHRALALPLRVTRDWRMLHETFSRMEAQMPPQALACIMPWIRQLVAEWEAENPRPVMTKPSKMRRELNRDVDAILDGRAPKRFPRLTEQLNTVCLSGKALFSQYRMLTATNTNPSPSMVIVEAPRTLPDWLITHTQDVLEDWAAEQAERATLERKQ